MNRDSNLESLLESIKAIAQEGLSFAEDDYDIARYQKLRDLVAKNYADISGAATAKIREELFTEQGCITPKLGVDTAIMNEDGAVLVLKRPDGSWGMPGGWADVGESPFATAQRETFEESGLSISPIGYVLITHRTPLTHPGSVSQVNICVGAKKVPIDSTITLSHEHSDYKWIHSVEEIDNWHTGQKRLFPRIFDAYRNDIFIPDVQ